MEKTEYRLYWWYSDINDETHRFVAKFKTMEELIEMHKKVRPHSSLYNYPVQGHDYFKVMKEILPEQQAIIYKGKGD